MERPHPAADLVIAAVALVMAAGLLVGAASLPPPRWEPLGSAAVPRALAALLALFGLIIGVPALVRVLRGGSFPPMLADPGGVLRGAGVFVLTGLFVFSMDRLSVPFIAAGPVFVVTLALLIGGPSWRRFGFAAAGGVALCTTLALVFTRFFYINLP